MARYITNSFFMAEIRKYGVVKAKLACSISNERKSETCSGHWSFMSISTFAINIFAIKIGLIRNIINSSRNNSTTMKAESNKDKIDGEILDELWSFFSEIE